MSALQLPQSYDLSPLAPRILLYDNNFRLLYEWTHPVLADPPTQDFVLAAWSIQLGVNSNAGSCNVSIEDHQHELTDESGDLLIRPGHIIQILLGKPGGSLDTYFTGIVNQPQVRRPGYRQQFVDISAFGYSNTLATRYVNIDHEQERNADDTLNDSDLSAKVSEIVKSVFHDDNLLLPPADPNISLDGIDDIDLKIASVQKSAQSQGIVIAELANIADAIYGIDPNLQFYFRGTGQHGGFIATNQPDMSEIDPDKLMIIRNQEYTTQDSNIRKEFTALIGLDLTINAEKAGYIQGTDTFRIWGVCAMALRDATDEGDIYSGSIPENSLQVMLRRTQEVSDGIAWRIYEAGSASDIRWANTDFVASGVISEGTLNTLALNQNSWVDIFAEVPASAQSQRWLLFYPQGNNPGSYNGIHLVGKQGSTGEFVGKIRGNQLTRVNAMQTMDGWPRYRIQEQVQTIVTAQNLQQIATGAITKENMQYVPNTLSVDAATTIFEGLLQQSGQRRRTYSMTVSAPSTRPEMGKRVSIIDTLNGTDTDALLIGFDVGAGKQQQLMAKDVSIELEVFL